MKQNTKTLMIAIVSLLAAPVLAGCAEQTGDGPGAGDTANVLTTCGNNVLTQQENADEAGGDATLGQMSSLPLAQAEALRAERLQEGMETLIIGSVLPLTGALANFGPDMKNGVDMAVAEVNAAANVAGQQLAEVEHISQDSQTDKAAAPSAMNTLVSQGASGVVGAASSGVTASILGIAVENGIVLATPASTSPSLTDPAENDNNGFFYRVPPSDALQGQILGQLVNQDGCESATIVAVNNPYGQGLARNFEEKFAAEGGTVEETIFFNENAATFSSEIEKAEQAASDAVVFIGYPGEGVPFVQQAFERGLMGTSVFFFSEGVKDQEFVDNVGASILNGLGGTTPATVGGNNDWAERFEAEFGHQPGLFASESYDAAVAISLAAIAAGSTDGEAIKTKMADVWNAPGVKVSDVSEAVKLVAAGTDIDWAGPSGDSDWDEFGDPTAGTYSYWLVDSGNIEEQGTFRVAGGEVTPA